MAIFNSFLLVHQRVNFRDDFLALPGVFLPISCTAVAALAPLAMASVALVGHGTRRCRPGDAKMVSLRITQRVQPDFFAILTSSLMLECVEIPLRTSS